jgi:Uma2 family endonuclease
MEAITSLSQLDLSKKYSYKDYLNWHFSDFVELIRGRIVKMSPAPLTRHQVIVLNVASAIRQHLRRKPCQVFVAPFDVRLPKKSETSDEEIFTVVQPDICIVCDPAKIDRRGCVGAPDMVIEVLSPGTMNHDVKTKYGIYEEFGVKEFWLVSPGDENVVVYHLHDGKFALYKEYSEPGPIPVAMLPGFSLEWSEIFT